MCSRKIIKQLEKLRVSPSTEPDIIDADCRPFRVLCKLFHKQIVSAPDEGVLGEGFTLTCSMSLCSVSQKSNASSWIQPTSCLLIDTAPFCPARNAQKLLVRAQPHFLAQYEGYAIP